jgi:GAF domain-containing protein
MAVSGIELFPTPPTMWVRRDFTLQQHEISAHPQLPNDDHLADHQPEHDTDPSLDLRDQLSAVAARGFDDTALTHILRACQAMGQYDNFDDAVSHIVYQCQQLMRADRITAYLRIGNKRLWSKAAVGLTKPIIVPTSSAHSAAATAFRRRASFRLLSTAAIVATADDDDDAESGADACKPDALQTVPTRVGGEASSEPQPQPQQQPSLDPGCYDAQCHYTTKSCLSVPVFAAHNATTSHGAMRGDPPPIGALELLNKTKHSDGSVIAFSAPDEVMATLLADEMSRQWHASQLRQQVADINRTLCLAYTMSDMVANHVHTGLLLSDLCELLAVTTHSAYCVLFTVDHGKNLMTLRHFREFSDCTGTVALPVTSPGILGAVMSSGKTCMAAGLELSTPAGFPEIASLMLQDLEVTSTLAAPVVQNITGAIVGVVQLVNKRGMRVLWILLYCLCKCVCVSVCVCVCVCVFDGAYMHLSVCILCCA